MTNEPNLTQNNKSQTDIDMARADLYNEVLKFYKQDKVANLRHALTQVNNALDAVTGLDYESYLKQRLIETKVELTRQLSLATDQSHLYGGTV